MANSIYADRWGFLYPEQISGDHQHNMKMNSQKISAKLDVYPFFKDIIEDGYHVFNLENARVPGYYPHKFPMYPGVTLNDLYVGDVITIRAFFRIGAEKNIRADGEYLDLEVVHIEGDSVDGLILTKLPRGYSLQAGSEIEVFQDEILYKANNTEH
jgi:hypothetical protein